MEEQSSNNKGHETRVFISYTREDYGGPKRLYQDLKDAGLNPWLEHSSIPSGQRWSTEIKNIIENSRYFIALLSSNSVDKRGSSERELKYALDEQLEVPQSIVHNTCEIR